MYRCAHCSKPRSLKVRAVEHRNETNGLVQYYLEVQIPGFELVSKESVGSDPRQAEEAKMTFLNSLGVELTP